MNIKYPKGEDLCVTYKNSESTPVCIMTSKPTRELFFLYEVGKNGELTRLGKSRYPDELEEKYKVRDRMKKKS